MERILSKDEISELLSAVRQGEIEVDPDSEPGAAPREREVVRLDLVRQQGAGRWRVANFDIILDAFARNYGISLTNRLQRSVAVKRTAIESMEFDPFLQQLSGRGSIGILRLDPLRWGGLMTFDQELALSLVEILLGGIGEGTKKFPDRILTAIETNVIRGVLNDACLDLAKAFRPLETLEASLVKVESNPRMVNIVSPEAPVLVVRYTITVNSLSGKMSLVIPQAALEPLRDKLREGVTPLAQARTGSWKKGLEQEVDQLEVELAARMAVVRLQVREILNFQVGDIIDLECDPSEPLRLLVEGIPKYLAQVGVRKGKKAIRISGKITNGVEHGKNG